MAARKKVEAPELVRVRMRFGGAGLRRGSLIYVSPEEAARLQAAGSAVLYSVQDEEKELEAGILAAPDFTED
jgi:hypothetical protein